MLNGESNLPVTLMQTTGKAVIYHRVFFLQNLT